MNPNPSPEQQRFLKLDEICTQFEQSWKSGQPPSLAETLAHAADSDQQKLLSDLLLIDLRYRLQRGQQIPMSQYQQQLPAHAETINDVFVRLQDTDDTLLNQQQEPLRDTTRIHGSQGRKTATLQPGEPASQVLVSLDEIGSEFGDYELLDEIGRGGMGVVYRARQKSLDREVAVKMILAGGLADEQAVERFYAEAQAVAQLHHPNIVRVYEVGEHRGHHFFSMDYIQGQSLAEVAHNQALSAKEAADYIRTIAEAIHCAHEAGIIHRDLKPANILTDATAQPLITDFGLAKRIEDDSGLTATGNIIGTPSYMPPEQVGMKHGTIGPASDIYALGAILYELLTGRPPFRGESTIETLLQVLEQEPVAPRILAPQLDRDLETITLKCLQKNPSQRYTTAAELAEELGRYWNGEPIEARPVTWMERSWRWCKRRPALAALVGLSITTLLTLTVGGLWYNQQLQQSLGDTVAERNYSQHQQRVAEEQKQLARASALEADLARVKAEAEGNRARASERKALRQAYNTDMLLARRDWEDANIGHLRELLARNRNRDELRGFEWSYWERLVNSDLFTLRGHYTDVWSVNSSPDGKLIVSGSDDATVKLWNAETGQLTLTLKGHSDSVRSVSFSPDGKQIVSGSRDHTVMIWNTNTPRQLLPFPGQQLRTLKGHDGVVWSVSFSPDGKRIVSGSDDKTLQIWDAETGRPDLTLKGHAGAVRSVSFSPDGKRIASGSSDNTIKVWDAETGQLNLTLNGHSEAVMSVCFDPQGKRLVSGSWDNTVQIWDVQTGQLTRTLKGHSNYVWSVRFTPDGKQIVSGSRDHTVKVWNAETGELVRTLKGHVEPVTSVCCNPDGTRIVSGSVDNTVKLWNIESGQESFVVKGHSAAVRGVAFSPNGKQMVSGSVDHTVKLWDTETGQEILSLAGHRASVKGVAFSPDGKQIVSGSDDKTLRIWDAETGRETLTLNGHKGGVTSVSFSPDGKRMVSGSRDRTVKVWNAETGQLSLTLKGHRDAVQSVNYSPDGNQIVRASNDNTLLVWDSTSGQLAITLRGHFGPVRSAVFSPDGKRIVSASYDKTIRVWDVDTGQQSLTLEGHSDWILSVILSPDGKRIVSSSVDNTVKFWDTETGQETLTLKGHSLPVTCVSFSPTGQQLVSGSRDSTLKVWDARPPLVDQSK